MIHWLTSPWLWFVIAGAIFMKYVESRRGKGRVGELMVRLQAWMFLRKSVYHVVHNVTIPADEGAGTTQIDHIYVSKFGVFVVETKAMEGWIYGSEHDLTWTQRFRNGNTRQFQNPLRQNSKHMKALAELLELADDKLISVIVFNGDTTSFKTKMPSNVCYSLGHIYYVWRRKKEILSEAEVSRILQTIEEKRLAPTSKTDREHIAYVQKRLEQRDNRAPRESVPPGPAAAPQGFCIRCRTDLPFNSKAPYCPSCYRVWKRYENPVYQERFCHGCGKEIPATMNKPLCYDCYRYDKGLNS